MSHNDISPLSEELQERAKKEVEKVNEVQSNKFVAQLPTASSKNIHSD